MCINILIITIKRTTCPRGEIGRHKGLKNLALWECQFESGRGHHKHPVIMIKENILFVFKDRKLITKNDEFWHEKFKHKYYVETLFINDHLNLQMTKLLNL